MSNWNELVTGRFPKDTVWRTPVYLARLDTDDEIDEAAATLAGGVGQIRSARYLCRTPAGYVAFSVEHTCPTTEWLYQEIEDAGLRVVRS